MRYIIDGYNLMFRILRAGDDLTKQREQIIEQIGELVSLLSLDATIVFDSQYRQEGYEVHHHKELIIVYTDQGQIADDLIYSMVKKENNPRNCTVVTSDNRLAWRVRRLSAKTQKVEAFFQEQNRRYRNRLKEPKTQKKHRLGKPSYDDLEKTFQKKTKEEPILNDFDRWLKIFEQRSKTQEDN